MCEYCDDKQKHIEELNTDIIYLEIYGKHLRLNGKLMGLRFGRDFMINYCPMCRKEVKLGGSICVNIAKNKNR